MKVTYNKGRLTCTLCGDCVNSPVPSQSQRQKTEQRDYQIYVLCGGKWRALHPTRTLTTCTEIDCRDETISCTREWTVNECTCIIHIQIQILERDIDYTENSWFKSAWHIYRQENLYLIFISIFIFHRKENGNSTHSIRNTYMLTMKGWEMTARMVFSELTCSTCLNLITSDIVIILSA